MIYLIKIIFLLLLSQVSFANENKISQILFKINNKFFTNVDLEERKKYVAFINEITTSEFSDNENKEILDDYISSLIFYEYYIQKKIVFKNLTDNLNLIFEKKFSDLETSNQREIEKFKFNAKIDLIRNKIIQEKLKENLAIHVRHVALILKIDMEN